MNPDINGLLTPVNAYLAGAILPIIVTVRRIFPKSFATAWGQRLLPAMPLLIGVLLVFCGMGTTGPGILNKIIVGIIAGSVAGHGYKTVRTSAMGRGIEDPGDLDEEPQPTPTVEKKKE